MSDLSRVIATVELLKEECKYLSAQMQRLLSKLDKMKTDLDTYADAVDDCRLHVCRECNYK